ncbi:hypothetical protein [Plantibacter sp. RU18]
MNDQLRVRAPQGLPTLLAGVVVLGGALLAAGTYCVFCITPGIVTG